jgi:hypothetical protein
MIQIRELSLWICIREEKQLRIQRYPAKAAAQSVAGLRIRKSKIYLKY